MLREVLLNGDTGRLLLMFAGLFAVAYVWKWTRPDRLVTRWVRRG